MKACPGHWRVRDESQEDRHVLLRFDLMKPNHKADQTKESKSSFSPEEPKRKILRGYCGGQLIPLFKLHWKGLGPISSLICTDCIRKGWAKYPVWRWESIRGRLVKEEVKVALRKEVKSTYVGFNCVRGQRPPRNVCPRWPVDLSVRDKNERKQIFGSIVAPALNVAQLNL